jgi:hypothetical protein
MLTHSKIHFFNTHDATSFIILGGKLALEMGKKETKANNKLKAAAGLKSRMKQQVAVAESKRKAEEKKKKAQLLEDTEVPEERGTPAEYEGDRVVAACELLEAAVAQGITLTKIEVQTRFNIGRRKLDKAIEDRSRGGTGRVRKGCHPILSHSQAEKVHNILTERAIKWNAVHVNNNSVGGSFVDVCLEVIRADMPNQLCVLNPPSLPTVKNWQRQARGINRSGSKKNDGRIRALIDIRSGLSFAAALSFLFSFVDWRQFFSSDDVSVMIYPWCKGGVDKPRVMLTQEAIDFLKEHNLSAGYSSDEPVHKQRVMEFHLTISTGGKLTCAVLKWADRNFTDQVRHTFIACS